MCTPHNTSFSGYNGESSAHSSSFPFLGGKPLLLLCQSSDVGLALCGGCGSLILCQNILDCIFKLQSLIEPDIARNSFRRIRVIQSFGAR
ncbi:hypothetical protein L596_027081 [Steinernema carpocapsae]|uniref:Uncharacterized protein n=1 Tax=Steinernema carpocapsae TaxID=34508 RepID=A0A4V5ZYD1_STECR|nr:hypothetical protein L596_027081 [Steinernema carpocapsae]